MCPSVDEVIGVVIIVTVLLVMVAFGAGFSLAESQNQQQLKKKGKHMPRLIKWIFWFLMLELVWKFVSNIDLIVSNLWGLLWK